MVGIPPRNNTWCLNDLLNIIMRIPCHPALVTVSYIFKAVRYVAFTGNVRVRKRISRRFPTYSNIFKLKTLNARVMRISR